MTINNETEFHEIPGFNGQYKINKLSQIKSIERMAVHEGRNRKLKSRILKNTLTDGYYCVKLTFNGESIRYRVHRLLAITFIPNPNNHKLVRHLNDCKTDNRLINLSWGSHRDNADDSIRNGTFKGIVKNNKEKYPNGLKGVLMGSAKLILDNETGIFYDSIIEAAKYKNLNEGTLRAKLRGARINNTSLIYA